MRRLFVPLLILALSAAPVRAARLKELVDVEGFRPNPLLGMGLVVGLAGTGDDANSFATRRPVATLLKHLGTVIEPAEIKAKNVALVMVTANLPPFARAGMPIDVTVSSLGTAKSLVGGTLVITPLKGADKETYALAQGSVAIGGFSEGGASGSSSKKNHVTVGHIPSGARVERNGPAPQLRDEVVLVLREPDFTTAARIAQAINQTLPGLPARVRTPATVSVQVPHGESMRLVAQLEEIEAVPDAPGRVIIDERTGTIVVGVNVGIDRVAIAYGGLTVQVQEQPAVSQPAPLSAGKTAQVAQTQVNVEEKTGQLSPIGPAALTALGIKPRDLVSIFQALKAAGALHAEVQVL